MKLGISFLVAVSLALSPLVLTGTYTAFAAQGYRWVIVNGPYACNSEQDAERITNHHTDAAELDVVLKLEQRSHSELNAENAAAGTRFVQFHPER